MPRNVEIKAKVHDVTALRKRARKLTGKPPQLLLQKDIFFHVKQGRFKLRVLSPTFGQLIFYQRGNAKNARESNYCIYETKNPEALRQVLRTALGEKIVVKKKRCLYLLGQTRIHIDEVEGLGNFMELEVVLKKNQSAIEGMKTCRDIMQKLDIKQKYLISCAYADLLARKT
ncbi:MAG: class IV adenylate cyclase [Verrucomicrobiota bacterium]